MAHPQELFESLEHPRVGEAKVTQELVRATMSLGRSLRLERRRRRMTLRELADMAGLGLGTVHAAEAGRPCEFETYIRIAVALKLRAEFDLVDPRRRERAGRQADVVHAAMGEAVARRLRSLGYQVRLDEPYQHYQFAGRADVAAWRESPADGPHLLHVENRTEFPDLQEAFGSFNGKRAYLGGELAARAGVDRWRSETHVMAVLWSADNLRTIRRHRASFEAVCPDASDAFAAWWSGDQPRPGRRSILVLYEPLEGKRSDRRRWVGFDDLDDARPRYRDYANAAEAFRAQTHCPEPRPGQPPSTATITTRDRRPK